MRKKFSNSMGIALRVVIGIGLPFIGTWAWGAATEPAVREENVAGICFSIQEAPAGLLTENGIISFNASGVTARRAVILGLSYSIDDGGRGLAPTADRAGRFFPGTEVGEIVLLYADGSRQRVPLIFGFNIWWYRLLEVEGFTRPFDEPEPQRVLQAALHLTKTGRPPPQAFMMNVLLKEKPLNQVVLKDDRSRRGFPLISAVTLEGINGNWVGLHAEGKPTGLQAAQQSEEVRQSLQSLAIDPDTAVADAQRSVGQLRAIMGTSLDELDKLKSLPLDIPAGYEGPRVRFRGGVCADILTNMFYHNVKDLLDKTRDGTYHTSTQGAPNWGKFLGCGTWKENVGPYYPTAWSRDFGCSLVELAELGYQQRAEALSTWAWKCADSYTERGVKYSDGTPAPPHWTRKINVAEQNAPDAPPEGSQENDGHGLLMLATYKAWQRTADRPAWTREHWKPIESAAEWICWQFEHPKLSGATKVLHTDGEAAGLSVTSKGAGISPLADFVCAEGLRAYAEIAESIGKIGSAHRWRARAALMEEAMPTAYSLTDPVYGSIWKSAPTWGGHYAMLGPIFGLPDFRGMDTAGDDSSWRQIDENSFLRQLHEHTGQPWAFHGETLGYGQAWTAQAGLILDRMEEATPLVEWLARFTYYGRYKPYLVPEGIAWNEEGTYWHRLGDLGNGVQQAAVIKVARLIVGVDDCKSEQLRIMPRLPLGWTGMEVTDYPAWTDHGSTRLEMDYRIQSRRQIICKIALTQEPASLAVRLGPYEKVAPHDLIVKINDRPAPFTLERSGDRQWIWVTNLKGSKNWIIRSE